MIDETEATNRAREYVAAMDESFALIEEATQEEPFGWVFFYNSAKYVETGDPLDGLGGNAPLVVFRDTGAIEVTGTAAPVEEYLAPIRAASEHRQH